MNNACCDVLCNLFKKLSDIHNRLTRHANISFYILPCCSKIRKDFIVNRGSTLWNSLESCICNCKSLNVFKRCVKDMILLIMYNCRYLIEVYCICLVCLSII